MHLKAIKTSLVLALPLVLLGCSTLASKNTTGVVVARRAQIRSSTAVVAADLCRVPKVLLLHVAKSTKVYVNAVNG